MKPCATCGVNRSVTHCYECGFDTCRTCEHSCEVTHESLNRWLNALPADRTATQSAELPSGTYHNGVQRIHPSFVYEAILVASALLVFLVIR